MLSPSSTLRHRFRHRGMALVIVLAFVVMVTFLMVAYLTRSQTDVSASGNHAKTLQANEVARLGADYLISGLQQEIREAVKSEAATSTSGEPKATIWPARIVSDDAATPVNERGNPREFLPFRISSGVTQASYAATFDTAYGAGVGAKLPPNLGSSVLTSQGAGGRSFNNSRWNAPRLLPFTPNDATAWSNCPTWVYVSRGGPVSLTAPTPFNATVSEMRDYTPANQKAVIGRFAYIMYDVSGLLDANVAGAPLTSSSLAESRFGEKGTAAFANLTPIFTAAGSSPGDAGQFVGWRTPSSVAADYYKHVAGTELSDTGLIEKGFRTAIPGSNAFLSRQDLLQFSRNNPTIIRGGRVVAGGSAPDADSGVLKYLRTWSRSLNAPMLPAALPPYAGGSGDWRTAAAEVTIPRFRVEDATQDDYLVKKGEPLFQRKFPLSRIRWFSNNDSNGQPNATVKAAILQHFGLTPAADLATFTTSPEWQGVPGFVYTSPGQTAAATSIKTLQEVASENREPDFFEWLKAAINPDTLGVSAGMTASNVTLNQDMSKDFQIIQIGANILDQVDVNDLPTLILTKVDGVVDRNSQPLVAIGVENLPYINELIMTAQREDEWGRPQADNVQAWLQPEIWMPHYSADPKARRAGYNSPDEIDTFRMRVVDGEAWLDMYADYQMQPGGTIAAVKNASWDARTIEPKVFTGDSVNDTLEFKIDDEDFSEPKLPGQSTKPNAYFSGYSGEGVNKTRQIFAGPEPGTDGFKGIKGGRTLNCRVVPGAGGGVDYQNRRYPYVGGGPYALSMATHGALQDFKTSPLGTAVPETAIFSLPMGERLYNAISYITTPALKPRNSPAGNPRPLTIVLEVKSGSSWLPVQMMESVVFDMNQAIQLLPSANLEAAVATGPTNAAILAAIPANPIAPTYPAGPAVFQNIWPSGNVVPGYSSRFVNTSTQTKNWIFAAGQVPEWLQWCRPILAGEDPDPTNTIYPVSGTAAYPRNDTDTRNPNEYLATNKPVSGKIGSGGGNESRFGAYFFGWCSVWSRNSAFRIDPRSRRFGQSESRWGASGGSSIRPTANALVSNSNAIYNNNVYTNWDAVETGAPGSDWFTAGTFLTQGAMLPNWATKFKNGTRPIMAIGDLMKNIDSGNCSYKDLDNVIRPADYAYSLDTELPTLPAATYANALKSKPIVLNRMFRSAAELGFVYRDVPWKSLDFFSEATVSGATRNPTSGDLGLLDVFCVEETRLSAGRVDPNKAPRSVLESLLTGGLEYPARTVATTSLSDATEIQNVLDEFLTSVSYNPANPLASMAITRDSDVAAVFMTNSRVKPSTGPRKQKSAIEAFLRGLSGSVDTRTWNVFIDVVAEAGHLNPTASDPSQFSTKSQRRYWVNVALDRITGRVLDYQYEIVSE